MSDKTPNNIQSTTPKRGAYLLRYWQGYMGSSYRFMLKSVTSNHTELFHDMPSLVQRLQQILEINED